MRKLYKRLILSHDIVQITVIISLLIIGLSVGITLTDSWLFNHPLMPALYLSVLIPFLVAPPVTYALVHLIRQLNNAEQQLLEREKCLSEELVERIKVNRALQESEDRYRGFAADIAHELRTPLSVLKLHLDDLRDTEAVLTLRREVSSMSHLVEQLLTLARIDSLAVGDEDEADLHAVSTNVAAQLAPLAIKEGRFIEVLEADGPVKVRGDSDALEQVVRNLVENAIKYSARGTTITIKVSENAKISVIDRGQGVPVEMRDEIFERFLRSDQRSGGSGLGLPIVRQIIDAHGGSIEVGETPDGGATFTISFANPAQ
tara:strand:- start:30 stop:980 length:951 start_codon:yes stop_codon:yes gene_type:complete